MGLNGLFRSPPAGSERVTTSKRPVARRGWSRWTSSWGVTAVVRLLFVMAIWSASDRPICERPVLAAAKPRAEDRKVVTRFEQLPLFGYGSWEGKAAVKDGHLQLRSVDSKGGLGENFTAADWSEYRTWVPTLTVRLGPKHVAKRLRLMVRDPKEGDAEFVFSTENQPQGKPVSLVPISEATLGAPDEVGAKGPLDLTNVFQWQLMGDYSGDRVDLELRSLELVSRKTKAVPAREKSNPAKKDRQLVTSFDQPPLFSYVSWEGKVQLTDGRLQVVAADAKGGFGHSLEADWSASRDWSPVLTVQLGKNHAAKRLRVTIRDDAERDAQFLFSTENQPRGQVVTLIPMTGATLAAPDEHGEKGLLDPSRVRQFQIIGDWSGEAVDLKLQSLELVAASPELAAARDARAQEQLRAAAARDHSRKELRARLKGGSQDSPAVARVSQVAADVLAIEIHAGRLVGGGHGRYEPAAGDEVREKKNAAGELEAMVVVRGGQEYGYLVGPDRKAITLIEHIAGDPLLDFVADEVETWTVTSRTDARFRRPAKPLAVYRKSQPLAWAQGSGEVASRHTVYLRLPAPLTADTDYEIQARGLNLATPTLAYHCDPLNVRSDAVHVHQIGYRPDDPVKRAFVSCWLGSGGALTLPAELKYRVVDHDTGKTHAEGVARNTFPASRLEKMARDANFNGTDVAVCELGSLPVGQYRLVVDGVGCSFPFKIDRDVWERALKVQLRGLFHNRSGVELGPPWTEFRKPLDMHPSMGYRTTRTRYRAVEAGGEAFAQIVAGDTGEVVADAWGGYHDAGDWNPRRVTHMKATMATLELLDLFPEFSSRLQLNIPPTAGVPDLLTEALFEFDCFLRLQQPDGGVGYGLESRADPLPGETSWTNSFSSYLLAPDYASSWYFAAVGARLSRLLKRYDAGRAAQIEQAAIKAFRFAEADWARDSASGATASHHDVWVSLDHRNLAAVELYRATGDEAYHEIFLKNSALSDAEPALFAWGQHVQRDQAFAYARLPERLGRAELKDRARRGLQRLADQALEYAAGNAFNVTSPDQSKPQFIGFYSVVDATDLVRVHFLTGDSKYLAGAVQATQFQAGCNPNNFVYTTGLGANPLQHVFKLDARFSGQTVPAGLTPYGNIDFAKWNHQGITWPITWIVGKAMYPDAYSWPTHEAYWDLGGWPMLEEFTVDAWAPNLLVWGYLAARR